MIDIENIRHTYKKRDPQPPLVLCDVSFSVERGEFFALLGPNGGGKSTLFHILSTFFAPWKGRVTVAGHDVVREVEAVRRKLGVVFQSPALDPVLSVRENLTHHGHLYGLSGAVLRARIDELTQRFEVSDRLDDAVKNLSGGLKRRAELAKGLLPKPEILLLDEPSTGLDPVARLNLRQTLSALCKKDGLTVLLTTHFMEEAEACGRVAILDKGRLVALGKPSELKAAVPRDIIAKRLAATRHDEATLEDVFMLKTGHSFE